MNILPAKFYSKQTTDSSKCAAVIPETDKIVFSGFETVLFNKQLTNLIHCPVTAKGGYVIPETVISLGIEAFSQCKGLTSVRLPMSLIMIDCLAFENCIHLTSITLPGSVVEIGFNAFSNCSGLTSIYSQRMDPLNLIPDSEVFYKVDKRTCILYVPVGSKKKYNSANQWKDFQNILENDIFMPVPNKN